MIAWRSLPNNNILVFHNPLYFPTTNPPQPGANHTNFIGAGSATSTTMSTFHSNSLILSNALSLARHSNAPLVFIIEELDAFAGRSSSTTAGGSHNSKRQKVSFIRSPLALMKTRIRASN